MLTSIARIPAAQAPEVVDVLHEAFYDYPVMRYVLGDEGDYDARLRNMIGLFVASRTLLDDYVFGITEGNRLVGVMTTSDPARPPHPDFAALREAVWRDLGDAAAARYARCVNAWQSLESKNPQLHVNMIGVRNSQRGTGLGRQLLESAHALGGSHPAWEGISLTTETPANVRFYEYLGYEVIGTTSITPQLQTWSMMRWRAR